MKLISSDPRVTKMMTYMVYVIIIWLSDQEVELMYYFPATYSFEAIKKKNSNRFYKDIIFIMKTSYTLGSITLGSLNCVVLALL